MSSGAASGNPLGDRRGRIPHYHLRAVASTGQQTLIEAPIEEVWGLISDPVRFPEWNDELEVTGVPTRVEEGATFRQTEPVRFGLKATPLTKTELRRSLDRSIDGLQRGPGPLVSGRVAPSRTTFPIGSAAGP